jgi:predicted 3-demethylubiquinone-9 3-methyltransferase (glyoxalase superfamily)
MAKMITHMWFADDALEAAKFYVSLLPDSRVDRVTSNPVDIPGQPAGSVEMVDFTLVPDVLADMLNDRDRKKAARAMEPLLHMEKIDIEELTDAFDGEASTHATTAKRRREG